jgi:peptidoglycan biosynthesis protein MviN/MurJ (putative lipid II flippase)
MVLSPVLADLLIREPSGGARETFVQTLLVLAPAAYFQIQSGAVAAIFNAIRRFPVSVLLYVVAGLVALTASAGLATVLGVVGAAIGVLVGSFLLVASHLLYARTFGVRLAPRLAGGGRHTEGLGSSVIGGVALGASQRLGLVIALSAVSTEPGLVTLYAYAFYAVGLILNVSSAPLSLVTLPNLVESIAARGKPAAEQQLAVVTPFVCSVLAPLLAALVAFGKPLIDGLFAAALSPDSRMTLYELTIILGAAMIPLSSFTLTGSVALALGLAKRAVGVATVGVVFHGVALYAGAPYGASGVAVGHVAASAALALLVLVAVFERRTITVVKRLTRGCLPAFLLAAVFAPLRLALGPEPSPAWAVLAVAVGFGLYALLALLLWPTVAQPFLSLARRAYRKRASR